METVGIKELRSNLSQYLKRVREGEHVIVTDRGTEIAELSPLSPSRKVMLDLASAGKVVWSGGKPAGLRGVSIAGKALAESVLEDRG